MNEIQKSEEKIVWSVTECGCNIYFMCVCAFLKFCLIVSQTSAAQNTHSVKSWKCIAQRQKWDEAKMRESTVNWARRFGFNTKQILWLNLSNVGKKIANLNTETEGERAND